MMMMMHKTLRMTALAASMAAALIATTAAVAADVPQIDYRGLEQSFSSSGSTASADAAIAAAFPAGTSAHVVEAALQSAGATCRTDRHDGDKMSCLFHQYSLADEFTDDVRWSLVVHTDGQNVVSTVAKRAVDRHLF
jgi:alkylation response protein AidB-like acyl-CoA dehydrogenase